MPAPPGSVFEMGPIALRLYPICVLAGFLAFMLVTGALWRRGGGDRLAAYWVCVLAAPAALVGARLYSFTSDLSTFGGDVQTALDFRGGGLGIYGAVAGGVLAIVASARARRFPLATFLDCCAPGLALGQAIGRFGNYFNQELVGGPTDLPWALAVDPGYRPPGYEDVERFHPAFLYESVLDLTLAVVLLVAFRPLMRRFGGGAVLAAYVIGYGTARFAVEAVRVDPTPMFGVLRLNQSVSLGLIGTGMLVLLVLDRRRRPR